MYLEKVQAHSTPKVMRVHMVFFTHLYFFQIACFLLNLFQDKNKDSDIILNRFFVSKSFKCKINTNMQFLHQIACKVFKK